MAKTKMVTYKLLKGAGPHIADDGTVYKAGEKFEGPDGLHETLLKGKVKRIATKAQSDDDEEDEEVDEDEDDEENEVAASAERAKAEPLGDDVTKDFPKAKEGGLLVFKKGKEYFVAGSDDPGTPLQKKGVTKKGDVGKLITKFGTPRDQE